MTYKFHSNCLLFSMVLIFLQFFQPSLSKAQFAEVDALLEQRKSLYGGNIVVLAWRADSIFYKKEIGELTINSQEPIAAASTWFTAALVMNFVDQGKISLDDPVSKYLPIFRQYAKGYLTIRHCLEHTTGLEVEKGGIQKIFQKTRFASLEEEVNAFASKREIVNNPGEEFYYSNIGINIVGRVLEIVGKKNFDRLMTEKIFRPLGMKKSSFSTEYAVNPYSGARSSAADYVKFMAMILNKGTLNGKKVLSEESVAELTSLQNKDIKMGFVPKAAEGYSYALGSWIQETNSKGEPAVLSSPGLFGSWAYIDKCRNYSCIVLVKNQSKEDKNDLYIEVKEEIDKQVRSSCN